MARGMTEDGGLYSMDDCLRGDKPGPHFLADQRRDDVVHCEQCFAMVTDRSTAPSTRLPDRRP
jgi:hypothetical protein